MALDLNQVQQAFLRANSNIDEMMSKFYDTFYNPTPLNITLKWTKADGTVQTITVPNRAKIKAQMWDGVNAAVGLWNRTFYVDVNGDDNNPGTPDAPFKTIKKAVNSVPIGGIGVIVLKNGQTHYLPTDKDIYVLGKQVLFVAWDLTQDSNGSGTYPYTNPPVIHFSLKADNTVSKFILGGNACIGFGRWGRGVVLEDDPDVPLNDPIFWGHGDTVPNTGQSWGYRKVSVAHSYIKLKKARLTAVIDEISLRYTKLFFDDSDTSHILMDVGWGTLRLEISGGDLVKYDDSASIGWNNIGQYIRGIVKDSNGIPRNIVSNIIL